MTKKKKYLPVFIAVGTVVLLFAAFMIIAAVGSEAGYGVTAGRLYFSGDSVFLIYDNTSVIVSDRSKRADLFEGYSDGDKIILVHDGVEESFPARTGGYLAFRISKGDGTYKPDGELLGIGVIDTDCEQLLTSTPVEFEAQYIRTDGYHEGVQYPVVTVISSTDELNDYYEANREKYSLDRRESYGSDYTAGFLDACDKYDDEYFEEQILVLVLLEEGSGSVHHKVESVALGEDGKCSVSIERLVSETGTADMAEWHILIEPAAGTAVTASDIIVYLDGVNPLTQDKRAQHARGYANMCLDIPHGWEYETDSADGKNDFCISFRPVGKTEGKISVWYYEAFGVCGTGLEEEKISLAGYEAYKGTYDGKKVWDFISLIGTPGKYVIMNEGADVWWDEYGDEAMQILGTLRVAEGILDEAAVMELVRDEVTVEYNQTKADFDIETGIWTICFYTRNAVGGDQTFTVTSEGKITDVVYGE